MTDPTSLLQLTFLTVDVTSLKPKVLGYSFFPIFIDTETKMPVLVTDSRTNKAKINRAVHKGGYQMPIYYEKPAASKEPTYRDYLHLERIPTCSLLLRVDFSSIDFDGNFISIADSDPKNRQLAYEPPPDYNSGAYSTLYYLISETERDMYAIRKKRGYDVPLSEVMRVIVDTQKVRADNSKELLNWFKG